MEISAVSAALPIFLASLLGSPHCAGMCGGFVAIYSHGTERHGISHLLYSLGRLSTYLTLGLAGAWLGRSIDNLTAISRASSIAVGSLLIAAGLLKIFKLEQLPISKLLGKLSEPVKALARPLFSVQSRFKPFWIGLVTTLLPCGWLYTFVALAIASADSVQAIEIMILFWLGTLPIMLSLGVLSNQLTQRLSSHLPRLTGVLLVISGLLSFTLHLQHSGHTHNSEQTCH